jgi:RTX calcium-binding nonapeptide repeat (4 copies)
MKRATGLTILAGLLAAAFGPAPAAQGFECGTVLDTFDRFNSGRLGPSWAEQAPDPAIKGQAFTVAKPEAGLATYIGATSPESCVDVTPASGAVSYAALVLRYGTLADNVFVKVQDNDANGAFDHVYFYRGNNLPRPWNPGTTSYPVPPFASARFHVAIAGMTVSADLDTNFDDQPELTIAEPNLPTTGLGGAIGLGAYGNSRLDDFAIPSSAAPPGLRCRQTPPSIVGSDGRDTIRGRAGPDVISALGGKDVLLGLGGEDLVCGGDGKDKLMGGKGADRLFGEAGRDTLVGGPKHDRCVGGPGKDKLKSC